MRSIYLYFLFISFLLLGTQAHSQCSNTSSFGSATAPASGTVSITTCMFAGEYNTLSGVAAVTAYTSTTDLIGGYFTIRQGTPTGPVVAMGLSPLNWSSTAAGTYYIHLNTNAACGTDFNCNTSDVTYVGLACAAATPTVTASSASTCAGVALNVNGVSAGNTIRWYTVPSGGTSLGSSVSGANFSVTPLTSTTYYAEAFNGSCASARASVNVSVSPAPTNPTPVTATPATICVGASTDLNGTSSGSGTIVDFTSNYACTNWTETHSPAADQGTFNAASCPSSLSMTSSNGGNSGLHSVMWTITVPVSGNLTFDWSYVTTDVDGASFDYPQYAINGGALVDFPNFNPAGSTIQSGSEIIAVTAGQTFTFAMTASDDILGAATTVLNNFRAPGLGVATINWYTVATGGTSIGSCASAVNYPVTPGATTTYYAESFSSGCASISRVPVVVTVETASTAPNMAPMPGTHCPNTTLALSAGGGTAGSGSSMEWYTGPNGTGTWMGSGSSLNITPASSGQVYYVRREGNCNTTADDAVTIDLKTFVYGLNGATTSSVCTDNSGWHHFFNGNEILLSVHGDLTGAAPGFPQITIHKNGTGAFQTSQGPFTPASCAASGLNPGEERFEMERSWNVDFGGGTLNPPYNVRFYHDPAEKTAVETAAANHMATYSACGYSYKYANPNGFFWFKNIGSNYTAPQWDGTHYAGPTGLAGGGTNYVELTGITSFSGGSGAAILVPTTLLPVEWLYFDGVTDGKTNSLRWATESEQGSDHFNIQRSKDGANFTTIGAVGAQGTSSVTNHYTFNDVTPFTGSNYYRLELVDQDGKTDYSNTVLLTINEAGLDYTFYPNPTKDIVHYQYEANSKEPLEIQVLDVYGRTLYKNTKTSQLGLNQIPVDLSTFPVGSYMVRINHLSTGNVHTSKVIRSK